MTAALLLAVRLYWAVWPHRWKRGCLYRESCSHHVHRVAAAEGFTAGMRALRRRYRTCRPGYAIVSAYQQTWVVLTDGSMLAVEEAAPWVSGKQ